MNIQLKLFILAIGIIAAFAPAIRAETIEIKSKIIDINHESSYLIVDLLDTASGNIQETKIDVSRSTRFEGYTDFQDVDAGDEVTIEADYNAFNHEWKALAIEPLKTN